MVDDKSAAESLLRLMMIGLFFGARMVVTFLYEPECANEDEDEEDENEEELSVAASAGEGGMGRVDVNV